MTHALSPQELHRLEVTERIASSFSLIGTSFILFTFLYSPAFRKPINRLIFYASWGNTLCNIATLISQSGVRAGRDSHLCQFQGFLIQLFLPADALWNLAVAINVYLTLFRKYNAQQLKALEWKYHIMCYGLPFIVAFVYIFINTPARGTMYGPATLWCWIDINWVVFRIVLVYVPAWCCILIAFVIYVFAGCEIFAKRRQLRASGSPNRSLAIEVENPFTSFKTTEIHITSELAPVLAANHPPNLYLASPEKASGKKGSIPELVPSRSPSNRGYDQYSITIDSAPLSPKLAPPTPSGVSAERAMHNRAAIEANAAAWGYTKVALSFFVSLLVTWVPSSINRVYSLIHPDLVSLPFTYASGIVLPLVGFWNALIYVTTSWSAVYMLFNGNLPMNGAVKAPSLLFNPKPSLGSRRRAGSESDSVAGLTPVGEGSGYHQV